MCVPKNTGLTIIITYFVFGMASHVTGENNWTLNRSIIGKINRSSKNNTSHFNILS